MDENKIECCICMESNKDLILLKCHPNHVVCIDCAKQCDKCPLCRSETSDVLNKKKEVKEIESESEDETYNPDYDPHFSHGGTGMQFVISSYLDILSGDNDSYLNNRRRATERVTHNFREIQLKRMASIVESRNIAQGGTICKF